jgi:serine phosphatase RsbU (regulator of sigma subunit)
VRLLNQEFAALAKQAVFATGIVTTFFSLTRRLIVCNAGHPRPLLYRVTEKKWDLLGHDGPSSSATPRNLPLGILDMTEYEQLVIELVATACSATLMR